MNVRITLRAIFIFFFWGVIITPNYAQKGYDWNKPLCVASDTGLGGPRYIETNFPLNKIAPPQVFEFQLRCKADVKSRLSFGGAGNAVHQFNVNLSQYSPLEKLYDISIIVTNLDNGQRSESLTKVFDIANSYHGETLNFPALGKGQFHNISVKVSLSRKILKAGTIPENPKPVQPLYLDLISIAESESSFPLSERYAPYIVSLVTTFDKFPDPCVTPGPGIYVPTDIDFGTLNREDLIRSVEKSFFFRIGRPADDTCNYSLYPIITFKATDPVNDSDILLANGTNLSFMIENLSAKKEIEKLKLNTPLRFGELLPKGLLNLRITANLSKRPDRAIRGGAFSTVLIYHIEFR